MIVEITFISFGRQRTHNGCDKQILEPMRGLSSNMLDYWFHEILKLANYRLCFSGIMYDTSLPCELRTIYLVFACGLNR